MPYKGVIRHNMVVFDDEISLPEGTPVTVIPDDEYGDTTALQEQWERFHNGADLVFQRLLQETGRTSDSADILRGLREERAAR